MLTLQYGRLTGGGLDDELKRRAKLVQTEGGGVRFWSAVCFWTVIREEAHNCQMVDFFFSWMGGLSLDALKVTSGVKELRTLAGNISDFKFMIQYVIQLHFSLELC